jgi:glycerol-3-phosphate acyltransferase PlsY
MIPFVAALALSYVAGSIPAALIAGRMSAVDLRSHGSGNLGATNVIRVLGFKLGIAVLLFDMAKGAFSVAVLAPLAALPGGMTWAGDNARIYVAMACGLAAIVGHVRPVFLGFGKGGKGVATACGVFMAMAPVQTVLTFVVFAVTVFSSGYVSLGSLLGAALMPVLLVLALGPRSPLVVLSIAVSAFVFVTHRANIDRLRRGEEHRFGKSGASGGGTAAIVSITIAVVGAMLIAFRLR